MSLLQEFELSDEQWKGKIRYFEALAKNGTFTITGSISDSKQIFWTLAGSHYTSVADSTLSDLVKKIRAKLLESSNKSSQKREAISKCEPLHPLIEKYAIVYYVDDPDVVTYEVHKDSRDCDYQIFNLGLHAHADTLIWYFSPQFPFTIQDDLFNEIAQKGRVDLRRRADELLAAGVLDDE